MISAIRKRHRIIWIILAVLLAAVFVASVISRHNEPLNDKIPQIKTK